MKTALAFHIRRPNSETHWRDGPKTLITTLMVAASFLVQDAVGQTNCLYDGRKYSQGAEIVTKGGGVIQCDSEWDNADQDFHGKWEYAGSYEFEEEKDWNADGEEARSNSSDDDGYFESNTSLHDDLSTHD